MIILNNVSLVTVSSVKIPETEAALRQCLQHMRFGEVVFFTDKHVTFPRVIIPEIKSKIEYSHWIIHELGKHLRTPFALICQWDGFIVNHKAWTNEFLNYDYIGSPWPPWIDNNYRPDTVGNGGFSLRSKKLCNLVSSLAPACFDNEDRVICEDRREQLEAQGIKFAPSCKIKLAVCPGCNGLKSITSKRCYSCSTPYGGASTVSENNPKFFDVLDMYFQGVSYREMGKFLGVSVETVRQKFRKMRGKLEFVLGVYVGERHWSQRELDNWYRDRKHINLQKPKNDDA